MKWLVLRIKGRQCPVYLVSPKSKHLIDANGDRLDGRCYFEPRRIYINKALDEDDRAETLLHELNHIIVRESGAYSVLESALPADDAGRVDEAFVDVGTSLQYAVLKDLGFRIPRPL